MMQLEKRILLNKQAQCSLACFLQIDKSPALLPQSFFAKGFIGISLIGVDSSSAYSTIYVLPHHFFIPFNSCFFSKVGLLNAGGIHYQNPSDFSAYPALQCYKAIERRNQVDNAQLRFWCEYWIIIAMLTVLERFGDLFV